MSNTSGPKYNLNQSPDDFADAIHKRLPNVDNSQIEEAAIIVLNQITSHLNEGDQLAFIRNNKDGSSRIFTLSIDEDN